MSNTHAIQGMRLTLLGTGNAAGLPMYGCACQACLRASQYPEYRRKTSCGLLETPQQRWLIDAGLMDLSEHFPPHHLSGILLTHYHMDHVQGLFHLRWGVNLRIPVISPDDTQGCDDLYKHSGILDFSQRAYPFRPFALGDVRVVPLPLNHSKLTLGYCFEYNHQVIAYLTDTAGLQEEVQDFLMAAQPDYMVIDCSFAPQSTTPKGHNDLNTVLALHERIQPKQTVLMHIAHTFETWLMKHADELPTHIIIGADGMVLE